MTGSGFDVVDTLNAIRMNHATFIVLTPPMVHSLGGYLKTRSVDLSQVQTVQAGGDAVTRSALTKSVSIFPHAKVCIDHGMTEGDACFEWPFFEIAPNGISFLVGFVRSAGLPQRQQ